MAEPVIQQQGADRIVVQLPGVQDTGASAKDILGRTATLEIRLVDEQADALDAGAGRRRCRSAPSCYTRARRPRRCCSRSEVMLLRRPARRRAAAASTAEPASRRCRSTLDARRRARSAQGRHARERRQAAWRSCCIEKRQAARCMHGGRSIQRARSAAARFQITGRDQHAGGQRPRAAAARRRAGRADGDRRGAHRSARAWARRTSSAASARRCTASLAIVAVHGRLLPRVRPDLGDRAGVSTCCCWSRCCRCCRPR
ncbi:MAG: hypothetical protein MZW92_35395 [Comamonadaceae bacterium]|nr:hypothetical protein [Comamonadaceae bacterium]